MKTADSKTSWLKFSEIPKVVFIGKEAICFGIGCHLVFYNLSTNNEQIYTANSKDAGDGITCYTGHRLFTIFAFTENNLKPRILIRNYPDFQEVCTLIDDKTNYVDIVFSDTSLLIVLADFSLTVWNWRTSTKIRTHNIGSYIENQTLRCSVGSNVLTAQFGNNSKEIQIWECLACGKEPILRHHSVTSPVKDSNGIVDVLWNSEGTLFVLDSKGNVYMLTNTYDLKRIIDFTTPDEGKTSFCWFKSGLTILGPNNEIRHYKKSGNWSIDWTVIPLLPLKQLIGTNNLLLGTTENNQILQILQPQNDFKLIKTYNLLFIDICLINPIGEFMIALSDNNKLNVFEISTGEKVSELILKEKALTVSENPKFPYTVIGYETGHIDLISTYNPNKLNKLLRFYLTKKPINSVHFHRYGKVFVAASLNYGQFFILQGRPGGKLRIIGWIDGQQKFTDFTMIVSKNCYQIFAIPTISERYSAGNRIIRYSLTKTKRLKIQEYTFGNPEIYYSKIRTSFTVNNERIFYCVPFNTRNIHAIQIKNNSNHCAVKYKIATGHQLNGICLELPPKIALTWSLDGFAIVRDHNFIRNLGLCLPHHRNNGGVKKVVVDPYNRYLLSLGFDNNLICTELINTTNNVQVPSEFCDDFKPISFYNDIDFCGKCWIEIEELQRLKIERELYQIQRNLILYEFKQIQKELSVLFNINLQCPDNERLDIEEFFLDKQLLAKKENDARIEQQKQEIYLNKKIQRNNQISDWLIENCLDTMEVPLRKIFGIFSSCEVENFGISRTDLLKLESLKWLQDIKKLEFDLNVESFQRCANIKSATAEDGIALYGSEIQQYVNLSATHENQFNLQNYYQIYHSEQLSKMYCVELKEYFNREFDEFMQTKIKKIDNIKEQNQRLRQIISEINYFQTNQINIDFIDPILTQYELPETIKTVIDDEIVSKPFVSFDKLDDVDEKINETETNQLHDKFYIEAIQITMKSVLETRWEDELKKDISLPDLLVGKKLNEYKEEDYKILQEYEEKRRLLNEERQRYREMLKTEFARIQHNIEENVNKFNDKLRSLFLLQLKIESIQIQENLKFNCLKYNFKQLTNYKDSIEGELIKQIENLEITMKQVEEMLADAQKHLENDCKRTIKELQSREKALQDAFKKDTQEFSTMIHEQAIRIYKKRSKIGLRNFNSTTLLNQLAKSVVTREILPTFNQDCIEFLNSLDNLDLFVGTLPGFDENIFNLVCRHRRARIEYELNWKAAQLNFTETQATINQLQKELITNKELLERLQNNLIESNDDYVKKKLNTQIQLIIPQGLVELQLTGNINDFNDAILLRRKDIENINEIINIFGDKKLKQLKLGMMFDRKILLAEWQHQYMKMTIEDFFEKIKDIKSINYTRAIQDYLENKRDSLITIENEMKLIKASFDNVIKQQMDNLNYLRKQIRILKEKNMKLDKQIAGINIDVCEFNLQKDQQLIGKEKEIIQTRMVMLIKRANLANQIQKNHNEILILQTELELKRLSVYPTLKYRIIQ